MNKQMKMQQQMYRGIRKRSNQKLFGLPIIDIAIGPDWEKGEMRGHASGIIALGDTARGWIAIGGMAAGIVALGGLATGIVSFGGLSLGFFALGGLAVGAVSIGGESIGVIAIGGGAIGYYAFGGGAFGKYLVSAIERAPEAIEFFKHWFPFLPMR